MSSDRTRHYAELTDGGWRVSWLPDRVIDRNQATTAMVLAERVASGVGGSEDKIWPHIDGWASELGLSGPDVVGKISYYGVDLL